MLNTQKIVEIKSLSKSDLTEGLMSLETDRISQVCSRIMASRNRKRIAGLGVYLSLLIAEAEELNFGMSLLVNKKRLEDALEKVEFVRNNKGCLCELYKKGNHFNPEKEAQNGVVSIKEVKQEFFDRHFEVECASCHKHYRVCEEVGYHDPIWEWQEA